MSMTKDPPNTPPDPTPKAGNTKNTPVVSRQKKIRQMVHSRGFVTIEEMARAFEVTPQTIRRDINILCRKGFLQRYHGGAGAGLSTDNVAYSDRKILNHAAKQHIAHLVARHIPNRASLFINIGTTTEEVAKALMDHKKLRVITNNLNVASIMSSNENIEVIVAGGLVRNRDCGIIGEATIDFINQFKVDFGIIGISGIDKDGTLLDFDYREVRAARAIIDNSRQVYLVADHSKFGRNAMVRLGSFTEISAIFTDRPPPPSHIKVFESSDVALHITPQTNAA